MGASVVGTTGIVSLGGLGPLGSAPGPIPLVVGPTTTIGAGGPLTYNARTTDANIRVTPASFGTYTINLPSASLPAPFTAIDGQLITITNYSQSGSFVNIVPPGAGDSIDLGASLPITFFGASVTLQARVDSSNNTNWSIIGGNTRECFVFPLHPALVINMTNVALGAIAIPQGIRSVRSIALVLSSNLTAGTITATVGAIGLTASHTVSGTIGFNGGQILAAPGQTGYQTVPTQPSASANTSAYVNATISTNGTFAGPSDCAVLLDTY